MAESSHLEALAVAQLRQRCKEIPVEAHEIDGPGKVARYSRITFVFWIAQAIY